MPAPVHSALELRTIRASAAHFTREAQLEGRRHLVAPVVLLVEGVHHGSKGKALYTAEELATYPDSWNGVPVSLQHPADAEGHPMSANAPEVIDEQVIGRLFGVFYEGGKLKGEIWVDAEKTKRVSPELLEGLVNGDEIEVSTGHWSEDLIGEGMWNGEQYDAIVRHIRPDHLALLPGAVGACSWDDGCGVRRNDACTCQPIAGKARATKMNFRELIRRLSAGLGFKTEELSHDDLRSKLVAKLSDSMPNHSHYIRDVYDNNFIFEMSSMLNPYGSYELYRVGYSIDANDEVEMVGEPEKVREERSYVPVGNEQGAETMTKEETIGNLIKDPKNKLQESDRGWLRTLAPENLSKFVVNEPPPPPPSPAEPPAPEIKEPPAEPEEKTVAAAPSGSTPETPPAAPPPTPPATPATQPTVEAYVNSAPPEIREFLDTAVKRQRQEKEAVVKQLLANKRCAYTEAQLKAKDFAELLVLARLAETEVDYSGRAAMPTALADDDAVPPMPKVFENV